MSAAPTARDFYGRFRTRRAIKTLCRQVENRGNKHPKCIILCLRQHGVGCAESFQKRLDKHNSQYAQQNSNHHGKRRNRRHRAIGILFSSGSELAARQNGSTRRENVFHRNHDEKQRQCYAHRRQRFIAVQHADIRRIHIL